MALISEDLIVSNKDLLIYQGNLALKESDNYHIAAILDSGYGQFYSNPLIGSNIRGYIQSRIYPVNPNSQDSIDNRQLKKEIRGALLRDGYSVKVITIQYNGADVDINVSADKTEVELYEGPTISDEELNSQASPKYITVKTGQNLFDICIEAYGSLEYIKKLLIENDFSINTELEVGYRVYIGDSSVGDDFIKDFFEGQSLKGIYPMNQWFGKLELNSGYFSADYSSLDYKIQEQI